MTTPKHNATDLKAAEKELARRRLQVEYAATLGPGTRVRFTGSRSNRRSNRLYGDTYREILEVHIADKPSVHRIIYENPDFVEFKSSSRYGSEAYVREAEAYRRETVANRQTMYLSTADTWTDVDFVSKNMPQQGHGVVVATNSSEYLGEVWVDDRWLTIGEAIRLWRGTTS